MRQYAFAVLLATTPAWGQTPTPAPSPPTAKAPVAMEDRINRGTPELRFNPVTRPSDPVGVIYAARVPGGCLLVMGANRLPNDTNTAQGGVFVPGQGCPRAIQQ